MLYNYIYKHSFIEKYHLRFDSNVIHEDELWTPVVLGNAEKVFPTHIIHYYYRQRKSSLSKNIPPNVWEHELSYISTRLKEFAQHKGNCKITRLINKRINQLESYIHYICKQP